MEIEKMIQYCERMIDSYNDNLKYYETQLKRGSELYEPLLQKGLNLNKNDRDTCMEIKNVLLGVKNGV